MTPRFRLLANITSSDIFLNISRHPWPVVYGNYLIVGFSIPSMCPFGDIIMNFTHDGYFKVLWNG
jgi:hypothetical protein